MGGSSTPPPPPQDKLSSSSTSTRRNKAQNNSNNSNNSNNNHNNNTVSKSASAANAPVTASAALAAAKLNSSAGNDMVSTSTISASSTSIQVAVRCRPFLPFEAGNTSVVSTLPEGQIRINPSAAQSSYSGDDAAMAARNTFTFDATFGLNSTQAQVYKYCVSPLVKACLDGYNATVIAYGQTGSGKTHSILGRVDPEAIQSAGLYEHGGSGSGSGSGGTNSNDCEGLQEHQEQMVEQDTSEAGVIPRALRTLFHALDRRKVRGMNNQKFDYKVNVQFLELYGEEIRDLLHENPGEIKLSIRDGRKNVEPEVLGATTVSVANAEEALLCLTRGTLRRVTRATAMNSESSRSHAIMSVHIEQTTILSEQVSNNHKTKNKPSATTTPPGTKLPKSVKKSKFHFVDLAGSERIKRTQASGQGVKEGININKGLLVLGNVISALATQSMHSSDESSSSKKDKAGGDKGEKSFVPYRDSKLTRLLKGSLGGNHKTLMIACVSPSSSNTDESLNTLRYANRAKNIQNKAVINEDPGTKLIKELKDQVKGLAGELLRFRDFAAMNGLEVDGADNNDANTTIFTKEVLKQLMGGMNVKVKKTAPTKSGRSASTNKALLKSSSSSSQSKDMNKENNKPSSETSSTSPTPPPTPPPSPPTRDPEDIARLQKAEEEISHLKSVLKASDDKIIEYERQLQWIREELRVSKEEIKELTATTDEGKIQDDEISVMTEDMGGSEFGTGPRLSQDTYQTVKSIYEEKILHMAFELKEREEERENIAMTLYRHDSDKQRLIYVRDSLKEDLAKKEEQIMLCKRELLELSNLTIIPPTNVYTERKFRRGKSFRQSRRLANNTNMSMTSYYTEKLVKIEKHIKIREEECQNLGIELDKLCSDSKIFNDLAEDLKNRLDAKEEYILEMKSEAGLGAMSKSQLNRLNEVILREQEERDHLVGELERLHADSGTFKSLVTALTQERKQKISHVDKYKRKHAEVASSIGLPSPYSEEDSGGNTDGSDEKDNESVISAISVMSMETNATASTAASGYSTGNITQAEFDMRAKNIENDIMKNEEDKVYILKDLKKLEMDQKAFTELSNSLEERLKIKQQQIQELKENQDEFAEMLRKQQKELAELTMETLQESDEEKFGDNSKTDDTEPETDNESLVHSYVNGRGESVPVM